MSRKFYILDPAPNAARLAVRLFYQDSFGNILKHIKEHYNRVEVVRPAVDAAEYLGMWHMLQETIDKKSRDKEPVPSMSGVMYRAAIPGGRYPVPLYQAALGRIRAGQDDEDSRIHGITRGRVATIKAYLPKNGDEKEGVIMALNEDSDNTTCILGRELVALEATQGDVNPGINVTIKDKYFNSACVMPAVIFPILFKPKNSRIKKMNSRAEEIYYEKILGDSQRRLTIIEG